MNAVYGLVKAEAGEEPGEEGEPEAGEDLERGKVPEAGKEPERGKEPEAGEDLERGKGSEAGKKPGEGKGPEAGEEPGEGREQGQRDIVTYGPIIHNEVVVDDLKAKGVGVIESADEIPVHRNGTIVIRSHGVPKSLYDTIKNSGARVVDTTCTFVKRIHEIVEQESAAGKQIVIIGNHGHAEVDGHKGWCADPNGHPAVVIETEEEARTLDLAPGTPVCVVAQTTFNGERFEELTKILEEKGLSLTVHNTICNATRERQKEAEAIARQADVMIVIGGRSSSNTAKLYEICRAVCPQTFLIQTVDDLIRMRREDEAVYTLDSGVTQATTAKEKDSGEKRKTLEEEKVSGEKRKTLKEEKFSGEKRKTLKEEKFSGEKRKTLEEENIFGEQQKAADRGRLHRRPRVIGITAGASTPGNIIEEVKSYVRRADF